MGGEWLPITELRLIFRHAVIAVATAFAVWVASRAFIWFVPDVKDIADLIDQVVFLGILAIISVKLLVDLIRGDGIHAFVAA